MIVEVKLLIILWALFLLTTAYAVYDERRHK